jgi:hypothetical protein
MISVLLNSLRSVTEKKKPEKKPEVIIYDFDKVFNNYREEYMTRHFAIRMKK